MIIVLACHTVNSWVEVNFDHKQTEFDLIGSHLKVDCRACHISEDPEPHLAFNGIEMECISCHENVHGDQFAEDGIYQLCCMSRI